MNDIADNGTTISVITTSVAMLAFVCVGTVCYLAFKGIKIPPELNTIAAGLTGSLVSMLVKTSPTQGSSAVVVPPLSTSTPTPVVVTNTQANPAETHDNT